MPGTGFRDYVEAVRAACDIAEVIGESVSLRKAGRSMVGLCPFHPEKTPSFHVDAAKGVYYCFGCQAGGDVFKFLTELHGVDFVEAAKMLGDRHGIAPPARRAPEARAEDGRRRRALDALNASQEYFVKQLAAADGMDARSYLSRRGIDGEMARRFGLGFAPSSWDALLVHLSSKGFDVEILKDAGLVSLRKEGGSVYDRFRSRITFPIRDSAARIVSFGGRAVGDGEPKYLNGPETSVYDKSRVLFRYSEVAQEIRKTGRALVVEGYFDAVGLSARGVPAVVAVCGTSLGTAHARLLRRLASEVVLFFDGDAAGRKAARRAMQPLLEAGLGVRVATAPDGLDPDELARQGGTEAIESCLECARELPEFLVAEARREFDTESLQGRVSALEMILAYLAMLPSSLARAEAADRVAAGMKITDSVVHEELRRAVRMRKGTLRLSLRDAEAAQRKLSSAESVFLRYLCCEEAVRNAEEATELARQVPQASSSQLFQQAIERWLEAREKKQHWDLRQLAGAFPETEAREILALAFEPTEDPGIEQARGSLTTLREKAMQERLRAIQLELDDAREDADKDRLMNEIVVLAREIQGLAPASAPE